MSFERDRIPNPAQGPGLNEVGLLPISTMVLWVSCLAVGVLGQLIPYPALAPPARPQPLPVQAQIMHVHLTKMIAPKLAAQSEMPSNPSPPQEALPAAPAPPTAVANPSPAIAFAVPIAGPMRFVPANQAIATPINRVEVQSTPVTNTTSQPARLILGEGEGRQPAPQYPFEAIRQGQQGTVVVRLTIEETGVVLTADAIVPCPYPLLNEAALRAVRDTWHFATGAERSYEVSIQFQLQPRQ
jgi:periplasmic protein TonB